ncbi:MAG TPA: YetF domain-containing protein [Thermohalobaculum sp.]|nr:YetF domain-containing protein [Thermohalobaculum sp.]
MSQVFGDSTNTIGSWQMTARAVVVLAYGLAVVRIFGRRIFGKWSPLDVILSVLIGSNLSRALTGNSPLLATLVSTTLLLALYWSLARLSRRVRWISWLVKGREVVLIRDGQIDWKEMSRHNLGPHDLDEALHGEGYESAEQVRIARLERNGDINMMAR